MSCRHAHAAALLRRPAAADAVAARNVDADRSGAGRRRRSVPLSAQRPLRVDRQCLRRRPEGADHAGGVGQGHSHRRHRGPAARAGRRAVLDRSRALSLRGRRRPRPSWRASGATSTTSRARTPAWASRSSWRARASPPIRRSSTARPPCSRTASAHPPISTSRGWRYLSSRGCSSSCSSRRRRCATSSWAMSSCPSRSIPSTSRPTVALERAKRDLANTVLRAPIAGIATQVTSIQMGRYLTAGMAVFSIIGTDNVWVDANPKETDLTYVRPGQPVSITVDAFPSRAVARHGRGHQPGHRRAVRHPSAAERRRQLDQDRAARAPQDRVRARARTCAACARA